jgi:hypothetical protein
MRPGDPVECVQRLAQIIWKTAPAVEGAAQRLSQRIGGTGARHEIGISAALIVSLFNTHHAD